MNKEKLMISAEDFLILFVYLVAKSEDYKLLVDLELVESFVTKNTELVYMYQIFANLDAAVHFVRTVNENSLVSVKSCESKALIERFQDHLEESKKKPEYKK